MSPESQGVRRRAHADSKPHLYREIGTNVLISSNARRDCGGLKLDERGGISMPTDDRPGVDF